MGLVTFTFAPRNDFAATGVLTPARRDHYRPRP